MSSADREIELIMKKRRLLRELSEIDEELKLIETMRMFESEDDGKK